MMSANYLYYFFTMVVFVVLKAIYPMTDHDQLLFILKPTNILVEFFTGSSSIYDATQGYYYPDLHITIEKSCSGFNFWLISFALSVFVSLNYIKTKIAKILITPGMLLLSYILTLFVNTSRILASIKANHFVETFSDHPIDWLHQAEGSFIYLLFLILFYSSLKLFYTHCYIRYEKLT